MNINSDHMPKLLKRLNRALLLGFSLVALGILYWSIVRVDILAHEDNPRLVEAELRIKRGRIFDSSEVVLAETTGPPDALIRVYPQPDIGPAVGYYSFRHGTAGAEESYDSLLRGDSEDFWSIFVDQTLHRQQVGRDIRLTLDAELQETAVTRLTNLSGALLLLKIQDHQGETLALVSQPGFDPNLLDEQFEALTTDDSGPLLNRITQGQYQPGLMVQPFLLAGAVEKGLIDLKDPVDNADRPVQVNGFSTNCRSQPPDFPGWSEILALRCPGPMEEIAEMMGSDSLSETFTNFGLTSAPQFSLKTVSTDLVPIEFLSMAAIGQDTLTVSPLQITLAWAALTGDGRLPTPKLVTAVQDEIGGWIEVSPISNPEQAITTLTANSVQELLPRYNDILEYSHLVLSGPGKATNTWYLGSQSSGQQVYVILVVIEESGDLQLAETIGHQILMLAAE